MNALRSAGGSCWSRANAAGDTSRTGCEKTADRPAGEVEGEHVEAERHGADHAADHELVDELDARRRRCWTRRAGGRTSAASARSRDSKPKRTGSAQMNSTAPTSAPAMPADRRGSSRPCRASGGDDRDDRAEPVGDLVDHHPAAGAELALEQRGRGRRRRRLMTTLAASTRTTLVASGAPMAAQNQGAAATDDGGRRRGSTASRASRRSARSRAASPGQRTIARLTPSSLKLRTASSASSATANVPNSSGPRMRASAMPISQRAEPRDHRVDAR